MTGKSKYIFLWSIDHPKAPLCKWEGHTSEVEIISWDPNKRMLASCSNEPYVLIWTPDSNQPHMTLDKIGSPVITIKWSNLSPNNSNQTHPSSPGPDDKNPAGEEVLLAAGCQDGGILIWNVRLGQQIVRLDTYDKE